MLSGAVSSSDFDLHCVFPVNIEKDVLANRKGTKWCKRFDSFEMFPNVNIEMHCRAF